MSLLRGKKIFVTGATGFIGAAMTKHLVKLGAQVICLARTWGWQHETDLSGAKVYVGDVCDYQLMSEIISTNEVEYILHFAANSIVKNSARDPLGTYKSNVIGTVSVLEAAKNVGKCKKILVASSDKAYGDHEILPYREDMPLQPKNTYDTSKACTDLIARSYAHNYDMPIVVTRCSNVYGPGDPNYSRIIPNTIRRICLGQSPMIYSDVSEMEREFIYIDDVVSACESLLLSSSDTNGEAFNVGGTGFYAVSEVVEKIKSLMDSSVEIVIEPRENTFKEIKRQYIDASKLQKITGWAPQTELSVGLAKTIEWYKVLS